MSCFMSHQEQGVNPRTRVSPHPECSRRTWDRLLSVAMQAFSTCNGRLHRLTSRPSKFDTQRQPNAAPRVPRGRRRRQQLGRFWCDGLQTALPHFQTQQSSAAGSAAERSCSFASLKFKLVVKMSLEPMIIRWCMLLGSHGQHFRINFCAKRGAKLEVKFGYGVKVRK